jgi:EAL domain-containing protein (putative c-di-GMP-specific phosphodiesterase class I)
VTNDDEGCAAADRILGALKPPMQLDEHCVMLSASIGITYGDAHATASSMLRDADIAMYKSKTSGKSRWTVYDKTMRLAALERVELETDLVTALQKQQFELVYQPIIELVTEEVVGFEALLRWNHPTKGAVQPDAFIPIAEENGCIVQIGEWVLAEACRMGAKFQAMHPSGSLTMAVNLSTRQIATVEIVEHVKESLRRSGFPAHSLVLEMTESALVEDATTAATRLHQLRGLGVRLAIDDFGTGYSSLSYLRQFPIDILKIDRSFISSITDPENIPAIVRGLLDLGKTLQLETVAEGIELGVQRDMLREQNCGFGQGFLFARPLSVSDCEAMLVRLDDRDLVP